MNLLASIVVKFRLKICFDKNNTIGLAILFSLIRSGHDGGFNARVLLYGGSHLFYVEKHTFNDLHGIA
jgi:hypothetical protein